MSSDHLRVTEITFHWEISILIRLGWLINYSNSLVYVAGCLFPRDRVRGGGGKEIQCSFLR